MLPRDFSCTQCAAAPVLQRIQGCFEDAPRVFAKYAGFEFKRCPLTYHTARGMLFVKAVRFKEAKWRNSMAYDAWRYVEFLLKLESIQHGDGP